MPRGRPKKVINEVVIDKPKVEKKIKTRKQELQELHEILVRDGIHSISKLEAMIAQCEA